jgi:ribosomal protein L30/L7E
VEAVLRSIVSAARFLSLRRMNSSVVAEKTKALRPRVNSVSQRRRARTARAVRPQIDAISSR